MDNRELEIIEDRKIRDKYIDRLDVLNKVGDLVLLPSTEYATTEQVSNYYRVSTNTLNVLSTRNKEELELDGLDVHGKKDIERYLHDVTNVKKLNKQGYMLVIDESGNEFKIANRGARLYTRRAVLRVGMLLRDSKVAKEVRTYLLNVEHDVKQGKTDILKNVIKEYSQEEELIFKKVKAEIDGDYDKVSELNARLFDLKNKRIRELETENENIITNALTIVESRAVIRKIIVNIGFDKHNGIVGRAWNEFYKQLNYKLNINIKNRDKGNGSYFDTLTDKEIKDAELIARNWAVDSGLDLVGLLKL